MEDAATKILVLIQLGEGGCEDSGGHPSHTRPLRGELQSLIRRGEVTAGSVTGVHEVRGVIVVVKLLPKPSRITPNHTQIVQNSHISSQANTLLLY